MPRTFNWKSLPMLAAPRVLPWSVGIALLAVAPAIGAAQGEAPKTHTVKKGDTLWDLARQYLTDPFLWPDIYRLNTQVVEDPHWIYPGEVLRLSGGDGIAAVPTTDTPAPPAPATDSLALADTGAVAPADTGAVAIAEAEAEEPAAEPVMLASATTDEMAPLFPTARGRSVEEILRPYTEQTYRALRASEFYASGFLTEGQRLPFGKVINSVTPSQIASQGGQRPAALFTRLVVEPPSQASYQVGDTLMFVVEGPSFDDHGRAVVPTGLGQVADVQDRISVVSVIAVYGEIRPGNRTLPVEPFASAGEARALPVADGVWAKVLGGPTRRELVVPQGVLFIDKGRQDGVTPGDLFEVRRKPERLSDGTYRIDELMATLQVVHARERSATVRVLGVASPDIPAGTRARQVAKLPS